MNRIEENIHKLLATVYRDLSNIEHEMRVWKPREVKHITSIKDQVKAYYNNLFCPLNLENTWLYLTTTEIMNEKE